jgi:molecular chaperone DnaK (HSP70)
MNVVLTVDHHSSDNIDTNIYSNINDNKGELIRNANQIQNNKEQIIQQLQNKINELEQYSQSQDELLKKNKIQNNELQEVIDNYKTIKGKELLQKEREKELINNIIKYLEDSLKNAGLNKETLEQVNNQKNELQKDLDNIELQIQKIIELQNTE